MPWKASRFGWRCLLCMTPPFDLCWKQLRISYTKQARHRGLVARPGNLWTLSGKAACVSAFVQSTQ